MASFIKLNPTSGTGDGEIAVSADAYEGRVARTGSFNVTGGGITRTVAVTQAAKAEFVTFDTATYSAAKTGGNVTISGRTNSSKLTFTLASGITVTIPTNYTAGGASCANGAAIANDPGASGPVAFSVVIAVPSNPTTAARSAVIKVTAAGAQTAQTTINQAAGDAVLTATPTTINLTQAGAGGKVTIVANIPWTAAVV